MKLKSCLGPVLLATVFWCHLTAPAALAKKTYAEKQWGVGMIMRGATIPFAGDETRVASLVPMMWFRGKHLYFLGTEGGFTFSERDSWRFSALGRMHFFDIPAELGNEYQGNTIDFGLQARYYTFGPTYVDFEFMSDFEGNRHTNYRFGSTWEGRHFQFHPYLELKLKTASYNSYFFGLDRTFIPGGGDLAVGFVGTFHFVSNMYAYGAAKVTLLDRQVSASPFVNKDGLSEVYLGLGLSNNRSQSLKPVVANSAYWRVAHGWATPSSLGDVLKGEAAKDEFDNQLTSIFYGHPLTDNLFGLPMHLYVNGGFVWHWPSMVQDHAVELVADIKLYYTIPLPVRVRLGAAEGVSYVNRIPYVEATQLRLKGYEPSNLLNFLDLSADINLGDIVGGEAMKHWWLGYGIHHRSAMFESVQHFGRIKGGSNFQTVYVQWHY